MVRLIPSWKHGALLSGSLLLALAIAEVGLRIWWDRPEAVLAIGHTGIHVPDTELGWRPRPAFSVEHRISKQVVVTVNTNSRGWRDREHSIAPPPGKRRVVVVGDSYTFGWGVEDGESFPARLEALDPQLDVVAIGAAGWNLQQYLKALEIEGFQYQPELVVIAFVSNDITDVGIPEVGTRLAERAVGRDAPASRRSGLFVLDLARQAAAGSRIIGQAGIRIGLWSALDANDLRDDIKPALKDPPPAMQERWRVALLFLERIREAVLSRGIPLMVATIPGRSSFDPATFRYGLARSQYAADDFDLAEPYRRIEDWCNARGVIAVNGYTTLHGQSHLFLPSDPHFNAHGHDLFARALIGPVKTALR